MSPLLLCLQRLLTVGDIVLLSFIFLNLLPNAWQQHFEGSSSTTNLDYLLCPFPLFFSLLLSNANDDGDDDDAVVFYRQTGQTQKQLSLAFN